MPRYNYLALTPAGQPERGVVDGVDRRAASDTLSPLTVLQLSRQWTFLRWQRTSPDLRTLQQLQILMTRLGVLVNAGVSVPDSLRMLQHSTRGKQREMVEFLSDGIGSGQSLSALTRQRPAEFGALIPELFSVAERSGTLGQTLDKLSQALSRQVSTIRMVRQVAVYPLVVTLILGSAILFLLIYIVPSLQTFIESSGQTLPLHTRLLIGLSEHLSQRWLIVVMVPCAVFGVVQLWYRLSARGRLVIDRLLLCVPIMGELLLALSLARICQSLSVLLEGGVDIVDSLEQGARATDNRYLRGVIREVNQQVKRGVSLSVALEHQLVLPALVAQLVGNGESAGQLVSMLSYLGAHYQDDSETKLAHCITLIGPILMCVVGALMLWVVVSVLGPVYESVFQVGVL